MPGVAILMQVLLARQARSVVREVMGACGAPVPAGARRHRHP
jgi:hypothetical protein